MMEQMMTKAKLTNVITVTPPKKKA
jgi:putative transposase